MLGNAFTRTLRDAQAGDEAAFARLWSDANPLMVRYLRVIGVDDPYDAACEGWITVVRGLPGFTGDEMAWRVWILACTRMRAEESTLRHGWGSVTALPGVVLPGADSLDADDLLEDDAPTDPAHRGLNDTVAALRALPLGQGEILMLRLGGALPVRAVSDVVGADVETVQRSEARALERVGAGAELLSWSLAAPATAAELADERVATAAFRSIPRPPAWSVPRTRVVALGSALTGSPRAHRTHGIANAAGRSRTALLGIALVSASAMSIGGLGAAAYVGALPDPVQKVMHDTIGAPAPTRHPDAKAVGTGTASASRSSHVTGVGPTAAASPAVGLCRAWAADQGKGTPQQASTAFRRLATTAGGADHVDAYCVTVLATAPAVPTALPTTKVPPTKGHPTTHPAHPSGTGSPTSSTVPTPVTTSTTPGTTTGTPDPSTTTSAPSTKTPNTNSPTSKTTKSSPAKTSPPKTSPPKSSPSKGGGKSSPSPTSGSPADSPVPTPVTTG